VEVVQEVLAAQVVVGLSVMIVQLSFLGSDQCELRLAPVRDWLDRKKGGLQREKVFHLQVDLQTDSEGLKSLSDGKTVPS